MNTLDIGFVHALNYGTEEALNTLCTNLSFSGAEVKSIIITSCNSGDGKSFLSMHICRILASFGKRVVLVDGDLRGSTLARDYHFSYGDIQQPMGLTHLLAGMAQEKDIIYSTNIPSMWLVPVAQVVRNSLPLLNSPRLEKLIKNLSATFDYVIVDAPPIGILIDAAEIAKSCDGAVMVLRYDNTRKKELASCYSQLEQSKCQILGAVINQLDYNTYRSRKYDYKSYYYYHKGYGGYYGKYYGKQDSGGK